MYPPGEVSEFLAIPPSTLRHYAKVFATHLSPSAQGRRRLYNDQDLTTLQEIKRLSDKGKRLDEIKEALGENIVVDEDLDQDQPQTSLAVISNIQKDFENIQAVLSKLQSENEFYQQKLDEQEIINQRILDWLTTPWYKRIGKKPPE